MKNKFFPNYRKIWDKLPFNTFVPKRLEECRIPWCNASEKIVLHFQDKGASLGLIADTSAGKTIMALLPSSVIEGRVLFLSPSRFLTHQHPGLFEKIFGISDYIEITGNVPPKKRIWNGDEKVVFATPHCFEVELKKNPPVLANFCLVVMDEFYLAVGDYPYVYIGSICKHFGVNVLGLTATIGSNEEKAKARKNNCGITELLYVDIPTAFKTERLEKISLDEPLKEIDKILSGLIVQTLDELYALTKQRKEPIDMPRRVLKQAEKDQMEAEIEKLPRNDSYFKVLSICGRYHQLDHVLRLVITDSYENYMEYCMTKIKGDKKKCSRWLHGNLEFRKCFKIAWENRGKHPKPLKLLELSSVFRYEKALIFINEKATARFLRDLLVDKGEKAVTLFGGKDRDEKFQDEMIVALGDGNITTVIATSVIEMGANIPEIGMVIHYNMPKTEISRKQRNGRTGRIRPGTIIFLCMDHDLDLTFYYATRECYPKTEEQKVQQKIEKKLKTTGQTSLF